MKPAFPLINPLLDARWLSSHATGRGIEIAIIDSGIDAAHPQLSGRVSRGCVVEHGRDGSVQMREISAEKCADSFGHGTAVAGIIAEIAPAARLVNVKVLDDYNACTGDILIAGMKWALEQGIPLLNMSLATSKPAWIPSLFELCERAFVQNSIVVAARRNFGDLGCPAMFSSVISVDREEYTEKLRVHYRPRDMIQFDARGTDIEVLAPGGGHAIHTGTSFATPHVCGIVALLREAFPGITAPEAKAALMALSQRAELVTEPTG
jgi:subtilisin